MAQQQQKLKEERANRISYEHRKNTILKSGYELSVLCDIKLCVLIVSPDGQLETWPNNLHDVKAILDDLKAYHKSIRYEHLNNTKHQKQPLKKKRSTVCNNGVVDDVPLKKKRKTVNNNVVADDVKGKEIGNVLPCAADKESEIISLIQGSEPIPNQENSNAFMMINNMEEPLLYNGLEAVNYGSSGFTYPSSNVGLDGASEWNGRTIGINNNSGIMGISNDMALNHDYYYGPAVGMSSFSDPVVNQDYLAAYSTCVPNDQWNEKNESDNYGESVVNMVLNQEQYLAGPSYAACGRYDQQYESSGSTSTAMNSAGIFNFHNNLPEPLLELDVCDLPEPLLAQQLQSFVNYKFPDIHM